MAIQIRTNAGEVIMAMAAKLLNPALIDSTVRIVATTTLAEMKTRVFEKGEASDNGDIGKYSTKPMYVSAASNPVRSFGRPVGKTGKSVFKSTGLPHKSRYFPGGYDEYKSAVGRNIGKVNLLLSGQMFQQMTVIATSRGYGLGWANREMTERAGFFTLKYKRPIWKLTADESELARRVAQKHFIENLNALS